MSEPSLDEQLQYRVEAGVGWITLNRPDQLNALTPMQRDRLIDLLESANTDFAVRCLVITATGRAFCTGADLRARRDPTPRPEGVPDRVMGDVRRMMLQGQVRLMHAVLDCEKPVIAAVNGIAAGIGAHLAYASDLVVAAESARFIEIFVRRGMVPDGLGSYLLTRLVGLQRAKELMLFGDDLPAARAAELGIVTRVVPDDQLLDAAREWAERLAAGPTKSIQLTRWLLNRSVESDRHTMAQEESWAVELNNTTRDMHEGMTAFVERRTPEWKGY